MGHSTSHWYPGQTCSMCLASSPRPVQSRQNWSLPLVAGTQRWSLSPSLLRNHDIPILSRLPLAPNPLFFIYLFFGQCHCVFLADLELAITTKLALNSIHLPVSLLPPSLISVLHFFEI